MEMFIVVTLSLLTTAVSITVPIDEAIPIVLSEYNHKLNGEYNFGFESGDGIIREETGQIKSVTDEENKSRDVVVVRGSYSYPDDIGKPLTITYYADETGFHAEGDSIP